MKPLNHTDRGISVSANNNNKRVRRAIVELLYEHGACTREQVAEHLQNYKGVKNVPSPNSISAHVKEPSSRYCGPKRLR